MKLLHSTLNLQHLILKQRQTQNQCVGFKYTVISDASGSPKSLYYDKKSFNLNFDFLSDIFCGQNEPPQMLLNLLMFLFVWTFCKAVQQTHQPSKIKHLQYPAFLSGAVSVQSNTLCSESSYSTNILLSGSGFLYSSIKLSLKGITLHHSHLSLKYRVLIGEYNISGRHRINDSFYKLAGVIRMCFSEPLHFHIDSSYSLTVRQNEKFCASLDRGNPVTESPCRVLHSFGML